MACVLLPISFWMSPEPIILFKPVSDEMALKALDNTRMETLSEVHLSLPCFGLSKRAHEQMDLAKNLLRSCVVTKLMRNQSN